MIITTAICKMIKPLQVGRSVLQYDCCDLALCSLQREPVSLRFSNRPVAPCLVSLRGPPLQCSHHPEIQTRWNKEHRQRRLINPWFREPTQFKTKH